MAHKNLNELPALPGIYIFKNKKEGIVYIGKAKSLRNRIKSYFQKHDDIKTQSLSEEIETIKYVVTKNELEALLLEAQLISQHQPKYNILLKDGQPFLYILFSKEATPKIKLVRNKSLKGVYFGPFLKKYSAQKVYDFLVKTFRLKLCNKKIENGCLEYHLGICAGNCKKDFDNENYLLRLYLAKKALKGDYKNAIISIKQNVTQFNQKLEFEKAQHLSEILKHFESVHESISTNFTEKKYNAEISKAESPSYLSDPEQLSVNLKSFFGLGFLPSTIDCFDISHFQGRDIVGSCVRLKNGKPEKNKFRRFKIKTLTEQNDCAALQEIVKRRYKNGDFPDLILIDGGKGQRNAIEYLIKNTPVISLAKREELAFSKKFPNGFPLNIQTDIGKILIFIRDYAHHFAINYHRTLRKKGLTK